MPGLVWVPFGVDALDSLAFLVDNVFLEEGVFALAREEIQFLVEGVWAKEQIGARRGVGPGAHVKEAVGQARGLVIGVGHGWSGTASGV